MVRILKILLIGLLSITFIACEDAEDIASKAWVYGEHYEYSDLPEGFTVNSSGQIEGFEVAFSDLTTVCGFHYYQNSDNDIFWVREQAGVYMAQVTGGPIGLPLSENDYPDEFTTYPFEKLQMTSVGRFVVISSLPAYISGPYGLWTRTNHQDDPVHDDCLMILDGPANSLKHYNHLTDTLTDIF